jgi:predicted Zn-dependent peptidase
MARSELVFGRVPDTDETIAAYDAVKGDDILRLANKVLCQENLAFSAVGRVKADAEYKNMLSKF